MKNREPLIRQKCGSKDGSREHAKNNENLCELCKNVSKEKQAFRLSSKGDR